MFATSALLLAVGLLGSGCEATQEAADDSDTHAMCQDYCSKKFDCEDHQPNSDETDGCVNGCRNSIEDNCGNNRQAAANDKIAECVDRGCVDFWACMVFEAAPSCFDFVNQ